MFDEQAIRKTDKKKLLITHITCYLFQIDCDVFFSEEKAIFVCIYTSWCQCLVFKIKRHDTEL